MDVIILAGGHSAEREISIKSGIGVRNALLARGHTVSMIDPVNVEIQNLPVRPDQIVFIALHGTFGEDGQIQQILEKRNLCFTGSSASASAIAFDKSQAKQIFLNHAIATPRHSIISRKDSLIQREKLCSSISCPVFVKPNAQGSSIGVSRVDISEQRPQAIDHALDYGETVIVEEYISGQEWTVAIFDEITFPPIQIQTPRTFYDFSAKYQETSTQYFIDQNQDEKLIKRLIAAAQKAAQAIETSGLIRVDFIVDNTGQPWCLELNTIPGMTSTSLAPKAASQHGWTYETLCENICKSALKSKGLKS
ncbi:MAG TPA: D-alanine--D-alanine ligase [Planctomycetaceae bacterium]|nr:D-alanine--D-alanine ligase [Planctomycetaceae bacterium]